MIVNVEDARRAARRRLPRIFFDYVDGGAFAEETLAANRADFARWTLVQRVLNDVSTRDLTTRFLGTDHPLPFMLGPVGFLGLYAGHGEVAAAKAAHAAGIGLCLSTFSIASLGQLRQETSGPLAFQLYVMSDRAIGDELLEQARAAGVETLFVTVDTAITSVRERDVRNGFRSLTRITPALALKFAMRPLWSLDMLRAGRPEVGAIAHRPEFGRGVLEQASHLSRRIDTRLSWKDIDDLRARWGGRLVLKGILAREDALTARAAGVDAIVVSNHGGRQLDGAASTIAALPDIAEALGDSLEILFDGGIRRGADIVKALALGASGVLLGRAYVYGLAAAGEAGVARIIAHLSEEVSLTLGLMGLSSIDELKRRGRAALRPR
ncbi:isopentenyl diphosphate isomerase/L-lactate dehydrogenase-like FMN-dependent dehydrogenase [Angulomicrobium tetraedrale]|uniref:Isopentenyl diphosphate isomerase/L-lactate dehydrogenase-like FMN-dependent dehydrogenase n=1 Tax=Ancylobacter tetraedralis TaxID=217068 RepID=A0A839Z9H6_9HYPH|nr:alpha-hydroxy acid oxidase [Ancylobacter tetraedralis]MBB3770927.1 isopentenyl diphosphate isomerase/L-lactate dehydrogenase-like FMN-dependent dehydrogenase [Ancylobacter tetraedralis]